MNALLNAPLKALYRNTYTLCTGLVAPLLYPFFKMHSRGKLRLAERYGAWEYLNTESVVWFHGASIGEVAGLIPLMLAWREKNRDDFILLTAVSPTGLARAKDVADATRLLPFDHPRYFQIPLKKYRVKSFIFGETELWPNVLYELQSRDVPTHLVNGVLTEKSMGFYQYMKPLVSDVLKNLSTLSASDELSLLRFLDLGADAKKSLFVGNTKYDFRTTPSEGLRKDLQSCFFDIQKPIVTLGSIHPGEWEKWKDSVVKYSESLHFIVAPRHRENFERFEKMLLEAGVRFVKRSSKKVERASCLLLDTYGELEVAYAISSLAFVGGTLSDIGGHNPFEPARFSVPVLVGPNHKKIALLVSDLSQAGGGFIIHNIDEIEAHLQMLLDSPQTIQKQGEKAFHVWKSHSGSTARILERIQQSVS